MKLNLSNPIDLKRAETYFNKLKEGEKFIELKEVKKIRTLKQNAYLHVCITLYAIHFGYKLYETKIDLKRACPFMRYEKDGAYYLKQTSKMDTKELGEFIDWIIDYAGVEGCFIPDAEDYLKQQFEIDKEISRHKSYL